MFIYQSKQKSLSLSLRPTTFPKEHEMISSAFRIRLVSNGAISPPEAIEKPGDGVGGVARVWDGGGRGSDGGRAIH